MALSRRAIAVVAMDEAFRAAHGAIQSYLTAGSLQARISSEFATLHLVTRSLSDAGWAQNAATARFPVQAYSLMRPAWEAMNLCDLFALKPDLADAWAAGDFRKFAPAAVRKALGLKDDAFYGFMSERSHPRFAGLQMTIFRIESESDSEAPGRAILHLNDVPIDVTATYMAVATPGIILARLTTEVGRLNYENESHRRRNLTPLIRSVSGALRGGWQAMDRGLHPEERDDPEAQRPRRWAEQFGGVLDALSDDIDNAFAQTD